MGYYLPRSPGDDTISGGDGNDGNDKLSGGDGNDRKSRR
ncbi:MAG: hypothetical protein JWN32_4325 [Solirubrobacterales bacterium]|nr:hypothetical protein [Solirubrobacterales bacterium]